METKFRMIFETVDGEDSEDGWEIVIPLEQKPLLESYISSSQRVEI